jgi:hypothetical protein
MANGSFGDDHLTGVNSSWEGAKPPWCAAVAAGRKGSGAV